MGERAVILGELDGAQGAHLGDAPHRAAPLIGGKLLVAEYGQPFLQRELEPVAASHPVAGPVVEVFVGDHRLDVLVIGVRRRLGLGQHITRVENVEALVLHRPHVEVADRDDIEDVEIVFEAKDVLVPAHRLFQRGHRMAAFVLVAAAHPDGKRHLFAGARRKAVWHGDQIAGDEREQVGGLGVRIDPFCPVPAVAGLATLDRVAVRQQHRKAAFSAMIVVV